jgi:hypothetical protein
MSEACYGNVGGVKQSIWVMVHESSVIHIVWSEGNILIVEITQ